MKNIIIFLLLVLFLSGCDAIDDMKGMFEKQELVQTTIKEKYGLESQVGFNISNGVLMHVTVIFNADDVRIKKISELESIAKDAISASFKSKPKAIYIQIATVPDKN